MLFRSNDTATTEIYTVRNTLSLHDALQIYADRDVSPQRKFHYDRLYIRRQSFALDVRLIALSFWITFNGSWERRGDKL